MIIQSLCPILRFISLVDMFLTHIIPIPQLLMVFLSCDLISFQVRSEDEVIQFHFEFVCIYAKTYSDFIYA